MLDADWRSFVAGRRTATLATVAPTGLPRLVPICFVLEGDDLYSPLDEKPKRGDVHELARVRDIVARPGVTLLFDRWSEDWAELAWLRAGGAAALFEPQLDPDAHGRAVEGLRAKYPQYRAQAIDRLPMLRITIERVTSWSASGALEVS